MGEQPAPRGEARALPLSAASLDSVRDALAAVVSESGGTGYRALNRAEVGYTVAAKTGSADLQDRPKEGDPKVLKHGWVAGWLPVDQPRVVFVVFCAETRVSSSHSAVWVARQLLRDPAIVRWIDAQIAAPAKAVER
ncbi:MAG: hypothetical protein FJ299_02265 [Planctomycetes bacterium]|nr:hypothetical protein [Planctomycetota bacterium]